MCLPTPPADTLFFKDFIAPASAALTALAVAGIGYFLALGQLRHKTKLDVREDLRKRQADALQTAWALLQCLTTVDNGQNLLRYTQSKAPQGQQAERQYLVHLPNAQAFVFERLPNAFYASGAGLHWPQEVKDLLFEARGIVYGYLLSEKAALAPEPTNPQDPSSGSPSKPAAPSAALRPVNKPELAERLQAIYQTLNAVLRKELQAVYA